MNIKLLFLLFLCPLMAIGCQKKQVSKSVYETVEMAEKPVYILTDPNKFLLSDSISFDSTYIDFLVKQKHLSTITQEEYNNFNIKDLAFSPNLSDNLYKIETQGDIKDNYSFIFRVFYENNPSDKKAWLATYDKKNGMLIDNRIIYSYKTNESDNSTINSYILSNKNEIKIHHSDFDIFLEPTDTYSIKILNTGKFLEFENEKVSKDQFAITTCNGDLKGKFPLKEDWTMIYYNPNINELELGYLKTETYGGGIWIEPSTVTSSIGTGGTSYFMVKGKLSKQDIKIIKASQMIELVDNKDVHNLIEKYESENPDGRIHFQDSDTVFVYQNKLDGSEYYYVKNINFGENFGYFIIKTKEGVYKPIGLSPCFDKIYAIQIKDKQYFIDCRYSCEGAASSISIYDINNDGKEVYANGISCD